MKLVITILLLISIATATLLRRKKRQGDVDFNIFLKDAKFKTLVDELRKYISTPWKGKEPWDMKVYFEEMKRKSGLVCEKETAWDSLCQSHAGDLLQHSQWTAYQIKKWSEEKSAILEGVDLNTAIVAAFFHDIGKGGDCIFDMYSAEKYNSKGDRSHPINCGDILMGTSKFFICDGTKKGDEINIPKLIKDNFPDLDINKLALAAYMHWEFGEINRAKTDAEVVTAAEAYLKKFKDSVSKVGLKANLELLKLCIAVSCADIAGSSNKRVSRMEGVLDPVYLARDNWVEFGMDRRHLTLRDKVIEAFSKSTK